MEIICRNMGFKNFEVMASIGLAGDSLSCGAIIWICKFLEKWIELFCSEISNLDGSTAGICLLVMGHVTSKRNIIF